MKLYFLFILFFSTLFSCKDVSVDSSQKLEPSADSSAVQPISKEPVKVDNNLGLGLTQEEIVDDTLFIDGSKPSSWEIAGINDAKRFKVFLKQVQMLVLKDDKEQLAKIIHYPLGGLIKNEKNFIDNYDQLFTKAVKLSIVKLNFSQISRNKKGVSTEGGLVWFSQEGNEFKIIAIHR